MKANQKISKISLPIFNTILVLLSIAGIGNLALSQIQISVITKVFVPEIGFFFFLYIIFGLVTFMNAMNMRKHDAKGGNIILLVGFGILSAVIAGIYINMLLMDVKSENLLTFSDIQFSMYLTAISGLIYGVGSIGMAIVNKEAKRGM